MRKLIPFLMIYVLIHQGLATSKAYYDGMSQETVDRLLRERQANSPGMTYEFVTKEAYDAVPDPTPAQESPIKAQARADVKDRSKAMPARFDALLTLLDLDK